MGTLIALCCITNHNKMKLNLIRIFLMLSVFVIFYTSCKKSGLQPLPSAKNPKTDSAAKQIAAGLFQSLNGTYGGVNINDGIHTPANFTASHSGPVIQSVDPMCGFTIDSTYNYHRDLVDVATNHYWGRFKFTYTCSSNYLDGYKVDDSTNYRTNNTNQYKLITTNQDFVVKALDNTYKLVSMNGFTGGKNEVGIQQSGPINIHAVVNKYTYNGVTVNFSAGKAVMKGTVTFTSIATDSDPYLGVTYNGSIVFPGDGLYADLTVYTTLPPETGATPQYPISKYRLNLVTGETSPLN